MLSKILSYNILSAIDTLSISKLNEIRLRVDKPIIVMYEGKNYYLCQSGITTNKNDAIYSTKNDLQYTLKNASDNSLYAVNNQIVSGYLTIKGGIRIGICGDIVRDQDKIISIKNISSLNIRIPHIVKNCSLPVYNFVVRNGKCQNTLIISPPGCGKTTFLRDIITQICMHEQAINLLVADERCEIAGYSEGVDYLDIGEYCDVYMNCTKAYAFDNGIRSMRPDVIACDELNLDTDVDCLNRALTCGVKVIATIHANSIDDLKQKTQFRNLINNNMFDTYIVLSDRCGVGTIECVYDKHFALISVGGR